MSTEEMLGRVLGLVERTHEDVRDIKQSLDRHQAEITDLRLEQAHQKFWFRLAVKVLGLVMLGASGAAGAIQWLE